MPSRRNLQAGVLVCFLSSLSSGSTERDPSSVASEALRSREFADALQILQPALQQSPGRAATLDAAGPGLFWVEEKKQEALASFRTALKISPDYLPALEGCGSDRVRRRQLSCRSTPRARTAFEV